MCGTKHIFNIPSHSSTHCCSLCISCQRSCLLPPSLLLSWTLISPLLLLPPPASYSSLSSLKNLKRLKQKDSLLLSFPSLLFKTTDQHSVSVPASPVASQNLQTHRQAFSFYITPLSLSSSHIHIVPHTQTDNPGQALTTPWTRNSNSLLLVALRAPPAESSISIQNKRGKKATSLSLI